jgi:hypothetical protein
MDAIFPLNIVLFVDAPCHPERSEGSRQRAEEILRCAHNDRVDGQDSLFSIRLLFGAKKTRKL